MVNVKFIVPAAAFVVILLFQTWLPLFRFPKGQLLHGVRNILLFAFNTLMLAVVFSSLVILVMQFASERNLGVARLLPTKFKWMQTLLLILLFDGWMYVWHRLNHEVKFFWRFHRTHHTDRSMDVTTALRFHPVELILSSIIRLGIFILLGMDAVSLILYETMMMPVIYFHHSNFAIPAKIDRILRKIIVTPWMHWVHHSDLQPETDSNYGTIFSWWDRLGRSFKLRTHPKEIRYGLEEYQDAAWQTLWGMIKTPFVSVKSTS